MKRWILLTAALSCACSKVTAKAEAWPEADALFRGDPRFLGADSAYSVALGGERILWLFGDTFAAKDDTRSRRASKLVRNSVAIQTGTDPSAASIQFFIAGTQAAPEAFFPSEDEAKNWIWPGTPVMVGGKLLLFLWHMKATDEGGSFAFAFDFTSALLIDNPSAAPTAWNKTEVTLPESTSFLGTGGAMVDGDTLWLLGTAKAGGGALYAARVPVADAARGDLSKLEERSAGFRGPTELSLSRFEDRFVAVSTGAFGDASVIIRSASTPDGNWSSPEDVFETPEGNRDGGFVYSAKGHPELSGADLVVTYCSSTDFTTLLDDQSYYYPRFLKLELKAD